MSWQQFGSISDRRQYSLAGTFQENRGTKALFLSDAFPFLIIGIIVDVVGDMILVEAETTHIKELEGRVIRIHIADIEVFYLESSGPPIPQII